MFVPNLVGTLMKVEEDPVTRYRYEVWFDYTRKAINTIAEGAMVAVPNFAGSERETRYSILEVTGILPIHYALGNDTSGYPGFVVEAARNAGQDWMTQDEISTEDTTKIRCVAIPTNLEIIEKPFSTDGREPIIQEEGNLPMVGHEVRLLDALTTERVANLNIDLEHENAIQIGTLVRDPNVRAFLRVEDLIKVHFGIFGFTGAGKSNLLSTLVRRLLTESKEPVKIVIFDLMSEYTGLLLDMLMRLETARIINIGAQTVPESVLKHLANRSDQVLLECAAHDFLQTTVLPKRLKGQQESLLPAIQQLFMKRKVWMWQKPPKTVDEIIRDARKEFKGNMGSCAGDVFKLLDKLQAQHSGTVPSSEILTAIEQELQDLNATVKLTPTAQNNLDLLRQHLQAAVNQGQSEIPPTALVSTREIIKKLNEPKGHALLVFQAHDPDELREFASQLSYVTHEDRRRSGQITPLVSFVFDEADEFIPGQPISDSQKATKAAAMTLARRGRKFGLGIGIATQRIRYLDTSILAQPHTYFISKLPRLSDRQAIAEAFGISEDMFRQTFKFKKGDWLLASYDAAGLEAIPIPIHTENAEEKILEFIEVEET